MAWNVINGVAGAVKATGAECDTGTDDAKYVTAKAAKDSHNVPSVVPSTAGNVLTSDGTDWTSAVATNTTVTVANEATDATCFPLFVTAVTGALGPKSNTGLTFDSSTGMLTATGLTGPLTGHASSDVATSVTVNGHALSSNVTVLMADVSPDAAIADNTFSGEKANFAATNGEVDSLLVGESVYLVLDTTLKWKRTDADAAASSTGLLGIVTETITTGSACAGKIMTRGMIRVSGSYTVALGAIQYLSLTPGDFTETAPSATADIVRVVGYAVATNIIWFCPDNTWIEIV